jgi:hypothetical protein
MHALQLCDWTVVRVPTIATITQGEDQWLDLAPFQECVIWVDCREATNTVTLSLQTSPTKDEAYFKNLVATITLASGPTPTAYTALLDSAPTPLARWLRWQFASTIIGPADAQFRIWVSANSPGM